MILYKRDIEKCIFFLRISWIYFQAIRNIYYLICVFIVCKNKIFVLCIFIRFKKLIDNIFLKSYQSNRNTIFYKIIFRILYNFFD